MGVQGNDTLQGSGGIDSLLGGIGDDILIWDGADTLNGGAGLDTLRFGGIGTLQFDAARMNNLEAIDLGAADDNNIQGSLSLADITTLVSSSSGTGLAANGDNVDLLIFGDVDGDIRDDVSLAGGWSAAGTLATSVLGGAMMSFDIYQANGMQVAVQQGLDFSVA